MTRNGLVQRFGSRNWFLIVLLLGTVLSCEGQFLPATSHQQTAVTTIDTSKNGSDRTGPVYEFTQEELGYFSEPGKDGDGDGYTDLHEFLVGTVVTSDASDPSELSQFRSLNTYLGESLEVRFLPEIAKLARKLEYDPVQMYNWVYSTIEYEPYDGSRKGALATLLTGRGNEWDQSTLLISLLRISGFPARYRRIRFMKTPNWGARAAYVEVWLPNTPYQDRIVRGIAPADKGIWYPLVPWAKQMRVLSEGVDLFPRRGMGFAEVPQSLRDFPGQYLYAPTQLTAMEAFEDHLGQYLLDNDYEIQSVAQIPRREEIVPRTAPFLPRALPSHLDWKLDSAPRQKTGDVEQNEQVWIDFRVVHAANGGQLGEVRIPLASAAGRAMAFDFTVGENISIWVDGRKSHVFPATMSPNTSVHLQFKWKGADGYLSVVNHGLKNIPANAVVAVGLDDLATSPQVTERLKGALLDTLSTEWDGNLRGAHLARMGGLLAHEWLRRIYDNQKRASLLLHVDHGVQEDRRRVVMLMSMPSSIVTTDHSPFLVIPRWIVHGSLRHNKGFWKDDKKPWERGGADVVHGSPLSTLWYDLTGHTASYNESEVLEDWLYVEALSTISGIFQAQNNGVELVKLTRGLPRGMDADGRYYRIGGVKVHLNSVLGAQGALAVENALYHPDTAYVLVPLTTFDIGDGNPNYVYMDKRGGSFGYRVGSFNGGLQQFLNEIENYGVGVAFGIHFNDLSTAGRIAGAEIVKNNPFLVTLPSVGSDPFSGVPPSSGDAPIIPTPEGDPNPGGNPTPGNSSENSGPATGKVSLFAGNAGFGRIEDDSVQIVGFGAFEMKIEFDEPGQDPVIVEGGFELDGPLQVDLMWEMTVERDPATGQVVDIQTRELLPSQSEVPALPGQELFAEFGRDGVVSGTPVDVPSDVFSHASTTENNLIVTSLDPPVGEESAASGSVEGMPFVPPSTSNRPEIVTASVGEGGMINAPRSEVVAAPVESGGDPVNLVTGEFYTEENPDLMIASRGPDVSIVRSYRSQLIYDGPFGYGWAWNHSESLLYEKEQGEEGEPDRTHVIYYDARRTRYRLTDNLDGTYGHPPGVLFELVKQGDTYLVTHRDGSTARFLAAGGVLLHKADRNGNALTFVYGLSGRLVRIRGASGQWLSLFYNEGGKVRRVLDSTGRFVDYVYDDNGKDLAAFVDASKASTSYEYLSDQENPLNNHNMSRYTLPSGNSLAIYYYKNDRVSKHETVDDNGVRYTFNFEYSPVNRYTTTEDESGFVRKVSWDENHNVIRLETESGKGNFLLRKSASMTAFTI